MRYLLVALLVTSCGKQVIKGKPGLNGQDGYSLVVNTVNLDGNEVSCQRTDIFQDLNRDGIYSLGDKYSNGFLVCDGHVGSKGEEGLVGATGEKGDQGLPGLNADTTYQVAKIINPCGNQSQYDEVILKLGNGQYLSSFSDNFSGQNTRFGLLPTGSYVTSDGTNCTFEITSGGVLLHTVNGVILNE